MDITASADAGNHLILTGNDYGSIDNFNISEDNNLLWATDQNVNNGADVAGTINGVAATGVGQLLTGATGTPVEGLVVKYTGDSDNTDVGTVNLTTGTAELFDRTLTNITDPNTGYLTFKESSLQQTIDDDTTQINDMNEQINDKMDALTQTYINMETTISTLKNQSSWLTSQVSTLSTTW